MLKKNQKPQKQKANKKSPHNNVIIYSTWFFALLFVAMIGYLSYFTATSKQEMINNSYNYRQEILLSRNYRGSILSKDGEILAETILDEEENETRNYPYGSLFSHIVGYSTKGKMGVEALGNYYLINSNAPLSDKAANDLAGKKNPGDMIYTTLDVKLQEVASDEMGIYKGAVVVTEVKTGKILALVSQPDFDPNEITEIWDKLVNDSKSSVLVNRATQGLYPPGSTFKILTALEYIRENPTEYTQYHYGCAGAYQISDRKIRCYHGMKHGSVDLAKSFAKSCNSSFANMGMTLDRDLFSDTLDDFYFNNSLPLGLTHAKSSVSVSSETSDAEMMQVSIGQGSTLVTPIHLNMITAAIANQGMMMKPYVMDRVVNSAGNVIESFRPESCGQVMTQEEAAVLTELMAGVVQSGTATTLKNNIYTAAGKTGSAEYNSNADSHAWFTGFAPVEDPEIAVTVIIEGAGSGGDYAAPIAKRIFNSYFTGSAYGKF